MGKFKTSTGLPVRLSLNRIQTPDLAGLVARSMLEMFVHRFHCCQFSTLPWCLPPLKLHNTEYQNCGQNCPFVEIFHAHMCPQFLSMLPITEENNDELLLFEWIPVTSGIETSQTTGTHMESGQLFFLLLFNIFC